MHLYLDVAGGYRPSSTVAGGSDTIRRRGFLAQSSP